MIKKNILFFGFDIDTYRNKLLDLLSKNDNFNVIPFDHRLEDPEKILKIYDNDDFKETLGPSIHSKEFHQYYLAIQRRRGKELELHECYCEWQINFSYFSHFLKEKKIDILLFANCPHQGIDIALWHVGKHANLETLFFWQVSLFYSLPKSYNINGKFIFSSTLEDHQIIYKNNDFKPLKKKVNLNESYRNLSIAFLDSKMKRNSAFYEFLRTNKFYLLIGKYNFKHFLRHFFAVLTLKKSVRKHFLYLKNLINRISINNENELNSAKPYIFFPLQQQPEMTTAILGGDFTEISDAIVLLAKYAEDKGINVVVKENPRQYHFQRSQNFFRRLSKHKNVKFVSTSFSAQTLINNSCGVSSITGTPAIEAVFSNKNVLIFGNPWFKRCKAFFSYQNSKDILDFLEAIQSKELNNGGDMLNEFLFDLSPKLCDGVIDPHVLSPSQKEEFSDVLKETCNSILKCLNFKFGI